MPGTMGSLVAFVLRTDHRLRPPTTLSAWQAFAFRPHYSILARIMVLSRARGLLMLEPSVYQGVTAH